MTILKDMPNCTWLFINEQLFNIIIIIINTKNNEACKTKCSQ